VAARPLPLWLGCYNHVATAVMSIVDMLMLIVVVADAAVVVIAL
jgi:hypothetical protein